MAAYPAYRASLDALYAVPMPHEEEPQVIFTPMSEQSTTAAA
jgi:hypothetical protein